MNFLIQLILLKGYFRTEFKQFNSIKKKKKKKKKKEISIFQTT